MKDDKTKEQLIHELKELRQRVAELEALETERRRAEEALRRQRDELAARTHILSAILCTMDLDERLNLILDEVLTFLGVQFGGLLLVQGNEVVLRCWRGISDAFRSQVFSFPAKDPPDWMLKPHVVHERLSERGLMPDFVKREGIQAWVCVPLRLPPRRGSEKGEWLGTVIAASRRHEVLREDDVRALTGMADQLALAIEHARIYRNAQERLVRLQTLRQIDRAIVQHLDLREVLHVVLEQVPKQLGADAVAISLLDEEQLRPRVFAMRLPNGTVIEEEAFKLAESLLYWFVKRQEPVIIYDLTQDPRVQMHRERIRSERLISYLGVPLIVRDKTIGILHVLTTQPKVFAEEDVDFFHTMAGQAAIAIENARMFTEATQRAKAVERMIVGSLDIARAAPADMGRVVCESLSHATGTEKVAFYHYDEATQTLSLTDAVNFPSAVLEQATQLTFRLGKERGLVGLVAATREALYLPDCSADPRWIHPDPSVRSAYCVPVSFGEKLFGVFTLLSSEPRAFLASQRALADVFAHYVASALENARLLAQAREAEQRYRSIFEHAVEGLFRISSSGQLVSANPAMARILGYDSPEELITNLTDIRRQLYVEPNRYAELIRLIEEHGVVSRFESQVYRKDGSVIWISENARAIRDASGALLYYEGSIEDITERKRAEEERKRSAEKLQSALMQTIRAIALTIEKRDPYTAGHQQRVAQLAAAIAKQMGLSQEQINGIRLAGLIHDIGKIYVPAEILSRPGRLSDFEFNFIKTHPQVGYDILKSMELPWPIAQIVLQHHERLDGSGYPAGLKGDEILLEAKILAVADVIEAMSSHRPYRPAHSIDKALEEISQNKGVLYDPEVVDACLKLFAEKGFKFE